MNTVISPTPSTTLENSAVLESPLSSAPLTLKEIIQSLPKSVFLKDAGKAWSQLGLSLLMA
ncbi:MAG: fatty acid desaturase, partial [Prochlorotrichaceae cyanobacterium]